MIRKSSICERGFDQVPLTRDVISTVCTQSQAARLAVFILLCQRIKGSKMLLFREEYPIWSSEGTSNFKAAALVILIVTLATAEVPTRFILFIIRLTKGQVVKQAYSLD